MSEIKDVNEFMALIESYTGIKYTRSNEVMVHKLESLASSIDAKDTWDEKRGDGLILVSKSIKRDGNPRFYFFAGSMGKLYAEVRGRWDYFSFIYVDAEGNKSSAYCQGQPFGRHTVIKLNQTHFTPPSESGSYDAYIEIKKYKSVFINWLDENPLEVKG